MNPWVRGIEEKQSISNKYLEVNSVNAPSIIIEYAFHSNLEDLQWMNDNTATLGKKTAQGIINYLRE